ncbi:MAG: hypothetical protein L0Z63_10350 [Actinobacteria bacterium]|nr:hypothetical protein [Actinomycetota bacterium]
MRIIGSDGVLLTTGAADLSPDEDTGSWRGSLATLRGTAVAGKALVVELEIPQDGRGRAQLIPAGLNGEKAISTVTGLGVWPFA